MITTHPTNAEVRLDGLAEHRARRETALRLPVSGITLTRIAEPVIEVRDGSGELLGVLAWARRDRGCLLGGWSGRNSDGAPWSVAVL